jgi:molecular chaperone DnaK
MVQCKLEAEALQLADDDVNKDAVHKLAGEKRRIAEKLSRLTSGKRIERLRAEYLAAKDGAVSIGGESGNDHERSQLNEVMAQEHTLLVSNTPARFEAAIAQLHRITFQILRRTPDFLTGWFENLVSKRESLNDQVQAKNLIEAGKRHIAAEDFERLAEVNGRLHSLLPEREQASKEMRPFTGIR